VTDESTATEEGALKKEFSIVRKGYDPAEVEEYLAEYDVALRELEEYAARLKHELAEARNEIGRLQLAEQESIDKAMLAVFDAKERIMRRAYEKAQEIEDEARIAAGLPPSDEAGALDDEDLDLAAGDNPQGVHFTSESAGDPATVTPDEAAAIKAELAAALLEDPATTSVAPESVAEAQPDSVPGSDADGILRQMLSEADIIKAQLEAGMSAAFEEMQRMQQDAEARAAELLEEARREAIRLRSAGADSKLVGTTLEVTLPSSPEKDEKRSRYSKTSAKLPRLGTEDGESVLASMNQLRNKLREAEAEERRAEESTAS
jgi:DivIVA domain-containing protein